VVAVYYFRLWNIAESRYESPPYKATADLIKKLHGRRTVETREEVGPSDLDMEGRYLPTDAFSKPERKRA
jgi:hypothetical protein